MQQVPAGSAQSRMLRSLPIPVCKIIGDLSTIPIKTKQEIRAAGAHGFVCKGKDSHDLLRVVRDVLNTNIQAASAASIH